MWWLLIVALIDPVFVVLVLTIYLSTIATERGFGQNIAAQKPNLEMFFLDLQTLLVLYLNIKRRAFGHTENTIRREILTCIHFILERLFHVIGCRALHKYIGRTLIHVSACCCNTHCNGFPVHFGCCSETHYIRLLEAHYG